jgi:citrate lyase subunit beta / citryl-CoA lyase
MRSLLFAPGNDRRKITKALDSQSDCVVVDLEDAVAINAKADARAIMVDTLRTTQPRAGTFVRINGWAQPDLAAADTAALAEFPHVNILIPMAASRTDVHRALDVLDGADGRAIAVLIETAAGLRAIDDILSSTSGITAVILGQVDLANDLRVPLERSSPVRIVVSVQVVLAARAAGIEALDGPWMNVRDSVGLENDCTQSRELGFTGRVTLHPDQIEPIHRGYSPDPALAEWARSVVSAFESAERSGVAALMVGNQFVDYPVYKRARDIVESCGQ